MFWIVFNSATMPYLLNEKIFGQRLTFLCIGAVNVVGLAFFAFIVKETKGLSDDQCKSLYSLKGSFMYMQEQRAGMSSKSSTESLKSQKDVDYQKQSP